MLFILFFCSPLLKCGLQFIKGCLIRLEFFGIFTDSQDSDRLHGVIHFNPVNHVLSGNNFPKNTVFVVQPGGCLVRNEKLTAICIGTGICHGQDTLPIMFQVRIKLIRESISRSAPSCTFRISSLDHKILDNPVEL